MSRLMIQLVNVRKVFGTRPAVEDLDLKVEAGDIFGLLGHNGAGKSTAIGMILGQVWPTSGEIKVCGHDITRSRQQALQNVGAIFEAPVFYDFLSGWRNLEILSHYTGRTSAQRIREVIDWVGLTGREGSKVKTYSHGMRARLALAQALLPNPQLLILDEPSDGLDPEGIHEMRGTILRLHRELKLTILLSSHLLNEVEQLCTRIAVMNRGKKVFEGKVSEAKTARKWIRLKVGDFEKATQDLLALKMIEDCRDNEFVTLSDGVTTDLVVRRLVEQGMPVFEIALHEQTLEDFYLDLMKNSGKPQHLNGR
jgi:ABC-2 type transport system ATP-binding protein